MRTPVLFRWTRGLLCAGLLLFALAVRWFLLPEPVLAAGRAAEETSETADAGAAPETRAVRETDARAAGETAETVEVFQPVARRISPTFSPAEADAITIRGSCSYTADLQALLTAPLPFALTSDMQVLIVHTHTTEAYTPESAYTPTGAYHTLDQTQNLLAVGDALAQALEARGIRVVHDRTCHDYPDYNHSYANAKRTIERELAAHPSTVLVLDLHRDAADPPAREAVTLNGLECAKLMFVVGTDEGGLYHPFWQENLSVALKLQALLNRSAAGLCRDLNLRKERFNGQTSPGALLIEVGSTGNTLEEAVNAMPYLADAITALLGR